MVPLIHPQSVGHIDPVRDCVTQNPLPEQQCIPGHPPPVAQDKLEVLLFAADGPHLAHLHPPAEDHRDRVVHAAGLHLLQQSMSCPVDFLQGDLDIHFQAGTQFHTGQLLSREQLLAQVWGYDYYGDLRVVDAAVKRLRAKVRSAAPGVEAITTVRGVGYKLLV